MNVVEENLPVYIFSSFTEDMVRKAFGLSRELKIDGFLTEWIKRSESVVLNKLEQQQLKRLNKKAILYAKGWNEQELREKLIAPIIDLVDFDLYDLEIAAFSEREMKVIYNESILKGKVEWMVAKGISDPTYPFFFIHEYKKETGASNDPLGQLLVTLNAAHILNNQKPKPSLFEPNPSPLGDVPLYGMYVVGRFWFFVRLKGKQYYISKAYISDELEDMTFILKMLKAQKEMIIELDSTMKKH